MDTQLNALPTLAVLARTVSGCVNSAFLDISRHFAVHLFRPWIPSSARGIDGGLRRSTAPAPPPLAPPLQGWEKDRSLAPSFVRAQQKHASRKRPSNTVNTNFSPAQPRPPRENETALGHRPARTRRRRSAEVVLADSFAYSKCAFLPLTQVIPDR